MGKKGLFSLSELQEDADVLGLVIQKYSCPVAAGVGSGSKENEIIEALL